MVQLLNNESLGQTAEKVICDLSGIDSTHLLSRSDARLEPILVPILNNALSELPSITTHVGRER